MKAVAVYPGGADSIHLCDLPMPSVDDVPDGRGVRGSTRGLRLSGDGPRVVRTRAGGGSQRQGPRTWRLRGGHGQASWEKHLRPYRHLRHDHRRNVLRARDQPAPRLPDGALRERPRILSQGARLPEGGRRVLLEPTSVVEKGIEQACEI